MRQLGPHSRTAHSPQVSTSKVDNFNFLRSDCTRVCLPYFSPYTLFWPGSQYGWCCNPSCWTDVTNSILSWSPGFYLKNTQFQNTPESHVSQIMNSMVVSILPLLGTSLPNRGLHTVKLEPGGAFDICDCFRDFIKMNQVCPEHHLQPWLPRTSACESSTTPWPPCPWKKISQVLALFILLLVFFLLSDMLSPFSEGELLEPGQGGPLPGLPIPQGVGPSTSAGHIQVDD